MKSPILIVGSRFRSIRDCATVFGVWEKPSGKSRLKVMVTDQPAGTSPTLGAILLSRSEKIPASEFSRNDLCRLFDQLEAKVQEEANNRVLNLVKPIDTSDADFNSFKQSVRDAYKLSVALRSKDGETFAGTARNVIESVPSDTKISTIDLDCFSTFQARFNVVPKNWFRVHLDFTKPPIFDFTNPVSQPTPNASVFEIVGEDDTWVRAVYDQLHTFFFSKKKGRNWLHARNIYDLFLLIAVIPIIIFILLNLSKVNQARFLDTPFLLDVAVIAYAFLLLVTAYRFSFAYTKWIFPLLELSDIGPRVSRGHRNFWYLLVTGILAGVIGGLFI